MARVLTLISYHPRLILTIPVHSLPKYQYTMKIEAEKWLTLVINSLHRIVSIVLKLTEIYANEVSAVNGKSLIRHYWHVITCIVIFIRINFNRRTINVNQRIGLTLMGLDRHGR